MSGISLIGKVAFWSRAERTISAGRRVRPLHPHGHEPPPRAPRGPWDAALACAIVSAMVLYGYWRSTATWRVRIALAHKGIDYELCPIDLRRAGGGDQHRPEYRAKNPMGQVPLLELDDEGRHVRLAQSLAILEYLEERWPTPPLLPQSRSDRARARQIAEMINSGIQPLQNTGVTERVRELGLDEAAWVGHWVPRGLAALETVVADGAGRFCVGDSVTFADVCLVPQLEFSRRFQIDLTPFPTLVRIANTCAGLDAFERAHADRQPDKPGAFR